MDSLHLMRNICHVNCFQGQIYRKVAKLMFHEYWEVFLVFILILTLCAAKDPASQRGFVTHSIRRLFLRILKQLIPLSAQISAVSVSFSKGRRTRKNLYEQSEIDNAMTDLMCSGELVPVRQGLLLYDLLLLQLQARVPGVRWGPVQLVLGTIY